MSVPVLCLEPNRYWIFGVRSETQSDPQTLPDRRVNVVLFLFRFVAFSSLRAYSLLAVMLALLVVTVTARDIARSRSTGKTKNSVTVLSV